MNKTVTFVVRLYLGSMLVRELDAFTVEEVARRAARDLRSRQTAKRVSVTIDRVTVERMEVLS